MSQAAPAAHWAPDQITCLAAALERVRELARGGKRPVVLLDLDDTILSTNRRHVRILREFCSQPHAAARYPEAAARLSTLEPPGSAYSIADIVRAAEVGDAVLAELREFWFQRFFQSDYVLEDDVVPGAPEYCRALAEAGGLLAYVTGRDEAMRPGTEKSLRRHGFPEPGSASARLVLKPKFDTPDLEFKDAALKAVGSWGPVAAGFENEPAHINLFHDRFPDGRMVLVETKHSGKPVTPYSSIGRIRDYRLTP